MTLGYLDRYSPATPPPQYARTARYAELRRQRLEEYERQQQEQQRIQNLREYQGTRVDTTA
jgi:hypothetical protein